MDFPYKNEIINLDAFESVFSEMNKFDSALCKNIKNSIYASMEESHALLLQAENKDQLHVALIKEQLHIQAQSSQYLAITDELAQKKNKLFEAAPSIYNELLNEIEKNAFELLQKQKSEMFREIERDASFYSGLRDTTKKTGGTLYNSAIKGINLVSKEFQGKDLIKKQELNTNSIVEDLLEKYLNNPIITERLNKIFKQAINRYEENWISIINTNIPNTKRLSTYSYLNKDIKVKFELGTAEQVFTVGLGSAVIGSISLAMGWHTMTYAMLNVFPPIALAAAVGTVLVGFVTKDSAANKRKKDIEDAVDRYFANYRNQMYFNKQSSLEGKSFAEYVESLGFKIIDETVEQWEKGLLGSLKVEHYHKLNKAFEKHLMYVQEAIYESGLQKVN